MAVNGRKFRAEITISSSRNEPIAGISNNIKEIVWIRFCTANAFVRC